MTKKEAGSTNSIIIIIKMEIPRSLQSMMMLLIVRTMILDILMKTDQITKIIFIMILFSMNMIWVLAVVTNATMMMTTTMTSMMMTMMIPIFLLRK